MLRVLASAVAVALLAGCIDAGEPTPAITGPRVAIDVAALNLAGVGDVVWDLEVRTAADVVWQRRVTSSAHGDSAGSASYVGPCDAAATPNTVRVWVVGVYAGDVGATDAGAFAAGSPTGVVGAALDFQNPTALAPLSQQFACSANVDAAVRFDVTLMRPATQGFFDVAVSFNDVFCAAKFDCCDPGADGVCALDGSEDLALLFDASGARARTFVLGFACTAGPGGTVTELTMDALALDCTTPTALDFAADVAVDVDPAASGNQCTPGDDGVSACTPRVLQLGAVDPDAVLYQVAIYRGAETLTSGGAPAEKRYWNVALGVKSGPSGVGTCRLRTRGSAEDASTADDGVVDGVIAAGAVYPYVQWDVDLGDCAAEQLTFGDPTAPVRAEYTGTSDGATTFTYTWAPGLPTNYRCAPACANGDCTGNGVCTCDDGWIGGACDAPVCAPACGLNSHCAAPGTCACDDGWTGASCATAVCAPACGANEDCVAPDTCACSAGWSGAECDVPVCSPACATGFACTAPNTCTPTAPQPCEGIDCNVFSYTGANQSFVVPAGVTSLTAKLWGAGGAGGGTTSDGVNFSVGGGGGFATATFAVTPGETLTIIVGGGGQFTGGVAAYGGGGGTGGTYGGSLVGGGGGRAAVRRGATELVTAGGG
ncbi:MAG: hypothetical protein CVU56_28835, partial [Deltaproteobacteria bacterium HGW-Deltaproteobacteria-14]